MKEAGEFGLTVNLFQFKYTCRYSKLFLKGMKKELKEAFRIYDKAGNGYIPISALKEILHELGLCIGLYLKLKISRA